MSLNDPLVSVARLIGGGAWPEHARWSCPASAGPLEQRRKQRIKRNTGSRSTRPRESVDFGLDRPSRKHPQLQAGVNSGLAEASQAALEARFFGGLGCRPTNALTLVSRPLGGSLVGRSLRST